MFIIAECYFYGGVPAGLCREYVVKVILFKIIFQLLFVTFLATLLFYCWSKLTNFPGGTNSDLSSCLYVLCAFWGIL